MIREFADYLQSRFTGEGPHTLFQRFKKVLKKATEDEIFQRNPCDKVVLKIDSQQIQKDLLSMEEIKQLALTHYPNENPDIRRAFLFCLFAGLKHTEKYTPRRQFPQTRSHRHPAGSLLLIHAKSLALG